MSSPQQYDVECSWPTNALFGSAPRSSSSLTRSSARQLVGMIGAQPRPVARAHVGRGVVHVDGKVQRSVVRVGAEVEQLAGQIEPIVDDGDDRRRGAVAVGQVRIGPALDERPRDLFVPVAHRKHERGEAAGRMVGVLPFLQGGDVAPCDSDPRPPRAAP